jgi:hypothetical protein
MANRKSNVSEKDLIYRALSPILKKYKYDYILVFLAGCSVNSISKRGIKGLCDDQRNILDTTLLANLFTTIICLHFSAAYTAVDKAEDEK